MILSWRKHTLKFVTLSWPLDHFSNSFRCYHLKAWVIILMIKQTCLWYTTLDQSHGANRWWKFVSNHLWQNLVSSMSENLSSEYFRKRIFQISHFFQRGLIWFDQLWSLDAIGVIQLSSYSVIVLDNSDKHLTKETVAIVL